VSEASARAASRGRQRPVEGQTERAEAIRGVVKRRFPVFTVGVVNDAGAMNRERPKRECS
jgi:hypothetical protein